LFKSVSFHRWVPVTNRRICKNLLDFETYQLREMFNKYLECKIFLCLISYNFKIKCFRKILLRSRRVRTYSRSRDTPTRTLPHSRQRTLTPDTIVRVEIVKITRLIGKNGELFISEPSIQKLPTLNSASSLIKRTSFFLGLHSSLCTLKSAFPRRKRSSVTLLPSFLDCRQSSLPECDASSCFFLDCRLRSPSCATLFKFNLDLLDFFGQDGGILHGPKRLSLKETP